MRFFGSVKEFTHPFVAQLMQLDYACALAFVAFDKSGKKIIGVVRIHSDSIYEKGEYAILLKSDLKGRGLGWASMQLIVAYAKSEGLRSVSGWVLQENEAMLDMCRELGFQVRTNAKDADLCEVTLALANR